MARWIAVAMLGVCLNAGATSYYVSNAGADGNNGTSPATAWRSLAKVNAQTLYAGDTVYLQRGRTWMEPLIPPSSGASGNPIKFDAYGSGAAPLITAATPMPFIDDGSWTHVDGGSGNTWRATIRSPLGTGTVNMVQFGKVYGRKQPYGTGCQYSIVSKYDWCVVWPNLYVYSPSATKPMLTYASDGGIVPIVSSASGLQVSSTTVQVDAGMPVPTGCGIEVRMHDFGWSASNDRNLLGRFGGRTFTLPRLGRTQTYFLRLYDSSSQPHYSRYAAALHVDYPYA
jgi:hypothetical protein